MNEIPAEIKTNIFSFLSERELEKLREVDRHNLNFIDQNRKYLYKRLYPERNMEFETKGITKNKSLIYMSIFKQFVSPYIYNAKCRLKGRWYQKDNEIYFHGPVELYILDRDIESTIRITFQHEVRNGIYSRHSKSSTYSNYEIRIYKDGDEIGPTFFFNLLDRMLQIFHEGINTKHSLDDLDSDFPELENISEEYLLHLYNTLPFSVSTLHGYTFTFIYNNGYLELDEIKHKNGSIYVVDYKGKREEIKVEEIDKLNKDDTFKIRNFLLIHKNINLSKLISGMIYERNNKYYYLPIIPKEKKRYRTLFDMIR